MANEFVARKGLRILEVAENNQTEGYITYIATDGTIKKIAVGNLTESTSDILTITGVKTRK